MVAAGGQEAPTKALSPGAIAGRTVIISAGRKGIRVETDG